MVIKFLLSLKRAYCFRFADSKYNNALL